MLALSLALATITADIKIEDLSWMVGSWECAKDGGIFEENWMPPSGGTMQAAGKLRKDNKTLFMEFISIEKGEKDWVMWISLGSASQGPQRRAPFKLTKLSGKEATFEFPENDFPSKIVYKANSDGTMLCRLTGKQDGKEVTDDYPFTKRKG